MCSTSSSFLWKCNLFIVASHSFSLKKPPVPWSSVLSQRVSCRTLTGLALCPQLASLTLAPAVIQLYTYLLLPSSWVTMKSKDFEGALWINFVIGPELSAGSMYIRFRTFSVSWGCDPRGCSALSSVLCVLNPLILELSLHHAPDPLVLSW